MQRMFPLPMVDNLIDRFTPHAITLRDQCNMFAVSVIERLDRIADGVNADADSEERRVYVKCALQVIGAQHQPVFLREVPPGQQWHLEYWTASTEDAPNSVLLLDSDTPDTFSGIPQSHVLAATSATAASMWGQGGPTGLVIPGGTPLYLTTPTNTPGIHISAFLQFRVHMPRPRRTNSSAGFRSQAPDRLDAGQEVTDTQRHVGSWHPGVPVFGPSAPNNNHGASS